MRSDKIKILKFITHFGVGGTERQFLYLTKGLDRSRFDIRVGCMAKIGGFMKDVEALKVPIWEYTTKSLYSPKTLSGQFKLARDIRREGIQIIHSYGFYPNVFTIAPAALGTRCVTIASVRDTGVFSDRHRMRSLTQSLACRLADCVLANSNAVRTWLTKQGLKSHDIRVIPNGIVLPPERDPREEFSIRAEFNIDRNAPLIAVISRLTRTKGMEFFLEAAAALVQRHPSVRFLIVGESCAEPEYRFELQKQAETLGLKERMIFTGQRTDVPKILREVDISVLPSLSESFSNTLLESMANGLPVVATDVGGNPELVNDGINGILVPPQDAGALCRAMTQLLESPTLARRLSEAAREKVVREYSLDSVLRQTEDLYMSLLEQRGRASRAAVAGNINVSQEQ
jgi:glycosyltransferase involved in cell wall biosynthesis